MGRQRLNRVKTFKKIVGSLHRRKEIQVLLIFNAKVTGSKIVEKAISLWDRVFINLYEIRYERFLYRIPIIHTTYSGWIIFSDLS